MAEMTPGRAADIWQAVLDKELVLVLADDEQCGGDPVEALFALISAARRLDGQLMRDKGSAQILWGRSQIMEPVPALVVPAEEPASE